MWVPSSGFLRDYMETIGSIRTITSFCYDLQPLFVVVFFFQQLGRPPYNLVGFSTLPQGELSTTSRQSDHQKKKSIFPAILSYFSK
mmetsp:Transcript_46695/g.141469  ORF Transcript_46695/g.141469 Transcript_46695/m.141469 type:complete len:86 (-) Transcript_46695:82-339(-)